MVFAFTSNIKGNTGSYFKGQEASLCVFNSLRVRSKVLIHKAPLHLHSLPPPLALLPLAYWAQSSKLRMLTKHASLSETWLLLSSVWNALSPVAIWSTLSLPSGLCSNAILGLFPCPSEVKQSLSPPFLSTPLSQLHFSPQHLSFDIYIQYMSPYIFDDSLLSISFH